MVKLKILLVVFLVLEVVLKKFIRVFSILNNKKKYVKKKIIILRC